jgi:hypothetical protein
MGTVLLEPVSGLLDCITVWRYDPRWPFPDNDRAQIERLTPYLVEANRISRLVSLQGGSINGVHEDAEHPWALIDARDAVVLEVNAAFVALLRHEWPDWRPPATVPWHERVRVQMLHRRSGGTAVGRHQDLPERRSSAVRARA